MKKAIAVFVSMIVLTSVVAAPAFAKISHVTSGSAKPVIQVSNTGDNSNICVPAQQVVNTGNVVNEQSVDTFGNATPTEDQKKALRSEGFDNQDIQDFTLAGFFGDDQGSGGDIDMTGSSINIDAALDASCDQSITQS